MGLGGGALRLAAALSAPAGSAANPFSTFERAEAAKANRAKGLCFAGAGIHIMARSRGLSCFNAPRQRRIRPALATAAQRQTMEEASLGMRQSPRGESDTLPTRGPSGMQERLNCCEKKRR